MPDISKTYKIKANDFVFLFDKNEIECHDMIKKSSTEFNLIKDHGSINAKLVDFNEAEKKVKIEIAGEVFSVEIKDEMDQMLDNMGYGLSKNRQIKEIKAPMPGLVLEIAVAEGDEVIKGDKMMILEAMKMENIIVIAANAKIKKILIKKGHAVERGQVLIELE